MLAPSIPDVLEPFDPTDKDRSELITRIRELERRHSAFELRVRICEEKEQLWKNLLMDMGNVLGATFVNAHAAINEQAEAAAKIAEQMSEMGQFVEDM